MRLSLLFPVILVGCAQNLPKQCIVTVGDGQARYGTFTQYIKGEGMQVSIAEKGNGCDDKNIHIVKDGAEIEIGEVFTAP